MTSSTDQPSLQSSNSVNQASAHVFRGTASSAAAAP